MIAAGLPRAREFDSTPALLREGYLFIANRRASLSSDIFATRLMLRPAICMTGPDAAAFFYADNRMTRRGALPPHTLRLLQDKGSVQQLDGENHRARKALFVALATPEHSNALAQGFAREWERSEPGWRAAGRIVLMDEVRLLLCRAACAWAGIPLRPDEAEDRSREFGAMIEGAGGNFARAVRGLILRRRTEAWARQAIRALRERGDTATPAGRLAHHCDTDGKLLTEGEAAVELLNLLRPICAVDRFIAFAAHALHVNPGYRTRLADNTFRGWFAQEVRRLYPFFPFVGGRLLGDDEFRGIPLRRGQWMLLDLYGTNHDSRLWPEPGIFRPERFAGWEPDRNTLIPQGGGDVHTGHRCPGEAFTLSLMQVAIERLAAMDCRLPEQDLSIDLARFPAAPASRIILDM